MSKKNKKNVPQVDENGEVIEEVTEKKETVFTKIGNSVKTACNKTGEWISDNKKAIKGTVLGIGLGIGAAFGITEMRKSCENRPVCDYDPNSDTMIDPDLEPANDSVPEAESTEE